MRSRRVIEVVVWINAFKRSCPELVLNNDEVPHASTAVDIHDQEEDELRKLHHQLDVFFYVHSLDDPSESGHSDQLQETKKRQDLVFDSKYSISKRIERYSGKQVNEESSFDIVPEDLALVKDLISTKRVIVGRLKLHKDIDTKDEIDNRVEYQEALALHRHWLQADF